MIALPTEEADGREAVFVRKSAYTLLTRRTYRA